MESTTLKKTIRVILVIFVMLPFAGWLVAELYYPYHQRLEKRIAESPVRYAYRVFPGIRDRALFSEDLDCMTDIKRYHEKVAQSQERFVPDCAGVSIPYDQKLYVLDFEVGEDFAEVAFYLKRPKREDRLYRGYIYKELLNEDPPPF